jgi:hypothetical protein
MMLLEYVLGEVTDRLPSELEAVASLQCQYWTVIKIQVWNLVSHVEGGAWAEGIWEQGAEENILIQK